MARVFAIQAYLHQPVCLCVLILQWTKVCQLLLLASAGLPEPGGSWTHGNFSSFHMELTVTGQSV